MTHSGTYEWIKFLAVSGTLDRIDDAANAAGLTRGEYLQKALEEALNDSEEAINGYRPD